MTITVAKIVNEVCRQTIGETNNNRQYGGKVIWLWKGEGYWWFMYNPPTVDKTVYETQSIYVKYLKDMKLQDWVSEGVQFVRNCQEKV